MNQKELFICQTLDRLFPNPTPTLDFRDRYTLLIAVLLSAHSTDRMVNRVTPALFERASDPQTMITLSVDEILAIVRPCGLGPKKAQAIWDLSHQLLDHFGGEVPDNLEDLETLAGVGHKTASVVLCQGFGLPAFPVDTHIQRCAQRWGLSRKKSPSAIEGDLKKIFPKRMWARLHLQIIYYARTHCPAKKHFLAGCPICQEFVGGFLDN